MDAADWNSRRVKPHDYYLEIKTCPKSLSSNNFHIHVSNYLTCVFWQKSCNPLLSNCFFKHLHFLWRLGLFREPALLMSSSKAMVSGGQTSIKCAWGYHVGCEEVWVFLQPFPKQFLKSPPCWADVGNGYSLRVKKAFRIILKISLTIFDLYALNTGQKRMKQNKTKQHLLPTNTGKMIFSSVYKYMAVF